MTLLMFLYRLISHAASFLELRHPESTEIEYLIPEKKSDCSCIKGINGAFRGASCNGHWGLNLALAWGIVRSSKWSRNQARPPPADTSRNRKPSFQVAFLNSTWLEKWFEP